MSIHRLRPFLTRLLVLALLLSLLPVVSVATDAPLAGGDVSSLERAADGDLFVSWLSSTGVPAFIRGDIPSGADSDALAEQPLAVAHKFLSRHRAAFGLRNPALELTLNRAETDELGLTHVRLQQQVAGTPVYGAELLLHFSVDGATVYAINGRYLPDLKVSTRPALTAEQALAVAQQALPKAELQDGPTLAIYSDKIVTGVTGDHLAWLITLYDHTLPARNFYAVDAHSGLLLDSFSLLDHARNRQTYNAFNAYTLPGTLVRSEGSPPYGDVDVDNAHDGAGATYDYYWSHFGRDSYDDNGAALRSTANYGVNYQNAFWNGFQMVYGDNFAVLDVAAHELTHAVTEYTANLVYRDQSGALNESFSDIFGAMVDDDDWLMGEDLPIGAIRSLENPPLYGDPDHVRDYWCTSDDNGGVHTNSGIQNKTAYLLSTATSRTVAGAIYYRALSVYLTASSQFTDARDAATQAAIDLYGSGSAQHTATINAFTQVGLDPASTGPSCGGPPCAIQATTADVELFGSQAEAGRTLATAYRARDEIFSQTDLGARYTQIFYTHTPRMTSLLLRDAKLRKEFATLLKEMTPGLQALADGQGAKVEFSTATVARLQRVLNGLAAADRDGALAQVIRSESQRVPWGALAGRSYAEAWEIMNAAAR